MAAKVFVLKKPAKCADCGKELPEGSKVRGYPLPKGGWENLLPEAVQKVKGKQRAIHHHPTHHKRAARSQKVIGGKCWKQFSGLKPNWMC